jgi:hypothetical protein
VAWPARTARRAWLPAELPLGLQHSPCGAQEGVVVDRLAVAAERPGSRQRRHSRDDDGDGKACVKQVRFRVDGDRVVDPRSSMG